MNISNEQLLTIPENIEFLDPEDLPEKTEEEEVEEEDDDDFDIDDLF